MVNCYLLKILSKYTKSCKQLVQPNHVNRQSLYNYFLSVKATHRLSLQEKTMVASCYHVIIIENMSMSSQH